MFLLNLGFRCLVVNSYGVELLATDTVGEADHEVIVSSS